MKEMSKKLISQRFLRCNPLKCDRSSTSRLRPFRGCWRDGCSHQHPGCPAVPTGRAAAELQGEPMVLPAPRAISQQETIAWPCRAPGSHVTLWDAVCPAVPSRAAGSSRCSPEDSLSCRKQVQGQDTASDCAMVEIFDSLLHPHVLSSFAMVSEERR